MMLLLWFPCVDGERIIDDSQKYLCALVSYLVEELKTVNSGL
jgi:hypothetical protein